MEKQKGIFFTPDKISVTKPNSEHDVHYLIQDHSQDKIWRGPSRLVLEVSPWPVFSSYIFFLELFYQLGYPFTLPFYLADHARGKTQFYFSKNIVFLAVHNFHQPVSWLLLIWFLIRYSVLSDAGISWYDVVATFSVFFAHRACVATKYSYLTLEEYAEFRNANRANSGRWLLNMQILTSWTNPPLNIFIHEIWMASRQLDLDLRKLRVYYSENEISKKAAMDEYVSVVPKEAFSKLVDEEIYSEENNSISALRILAAIFVRNTSKDPYERFQTLTTVLVSLRVIFHGLLRQFAGEYKYEFFGNTYESIIFVILSFIPGWFYSRIVLRFLYCSVVDITRKLSVLIDLSDMIRISEERRHGHPIIPLQKTENIRAWIGIRSMTHKVGYRYQQKMNVYNLVSQLLSVILITSLIITFVLTPNPNDLAISPEFLQPFLDICLLTFPTLLFFFFGAIVNFRVNFDKENLILHRVIGRMYLFEGQNHFLKKLSQSDSYNNVEQNIFDEDMKKWIVASEYDEARNDLLDSGYQVLDGIRNSSPVTVLGVPAEFGTLNSILTVLASVFVYMAQKIYWTTL
eukprot:c19289_g1_i1.p1 GENE.c19289_g1_i1~~c19289_g1_i1.p1  ORF type:complete len:573 (+),score=152.53 c19289_g1_i1:24-1742(+)